MKPSLELAATVFSTTKLYLHREKLSNCEITVGLFVLSFFALSM